jgi:hypothetical protein
MTELLINNQAVVLPDDFTYQIIQENPRFTKNGSYSLDLSIPLDNPVNAKIYSNINRFHNTTNIANRNAVIMVDNRREFQGKEIVLSVDNKWAKIQLVAGNSDLNFNLRDDKVRDLNLGSVVSIPWLDVDSNPDNDYDFQAGPYGIGYLNSRYPTKNFVYAPFYAADNEIFYNKWIYTNEGAPGNPTLGIQGGYAIPQPYLCGIIRKIIEFYGYSISAYNNDLEGHPTIQQFYLVHGNLTRSYAKMLPDWTVKEFFDNIEEFFDCRVLVQEDNHTVKIVFNKYFFDTSSPYNFEMIKLFSYDNLEQNTIDYSNANIGYDFDDYIYYRYARLDKKIKAAAIPTNTFSSEAMLNSMNDGNDPTRHRRIFTGTYGSYVSKLNENDDYYRGCRVDHYKDLIQNSKADKDILFKIMPAPFLQVIDFVYDSNAEEPFGYWNQYPVVLLSQKYAADENFSISEALEGDYQLPDQKLTTKMYLAVWDGIRPINYLNDVPGYSLAGVPMAFAEYFAEYYDGRQTPQTFNLGGLFRLSTLKSTLYSTLGANTTKKYRISFKASGKIDIRKLFTFDNKKFVCIKFERRFDKMGQYPIVDGEFYPVV